MKTAILAGVAAMAFAAGTPADATWQSNNIGTVKGWGSSGWGSSGWGSSGWGSSGYGSTGTSGGTSSGTSGGTSSGSTGSTSGGTSGGSSSGGTPVPEPSNVMMLGLGLAGLIAGRVVARRRKKL